MLITPAGGTDLTTLQAWVTVAALSIGGRRGNRSLIWTDLDRASEWIEGLTRITDMTVQVTTAGTSYVAWFGRMRSPSEILQVDRPRLVRTRFK